jgi:hypothetical protein
MLGYINSVYSIVAVLNLMPTSKRTRNMAVGPHGTSVLVAEDFIIRRHRNLKCQFTKIQ